MESLWYQYREELSDRALRLQLEGYLKKGEASVSELSYVLTRSGSQASIESFVERIYPTEFDSPEMTQELRGPIEKGTVIASPATPTAFQTRNTGLSVKVTPQVEPNRRLVDMDIAVDGVAFIGDDRLGQGLALVAMHSFSLGRR